MYIHVHRQGIQGIQITVVLKYLYLSHLKHTCTVVYQASAQVYFLHNNMGSTHDRQLTNISNKNVKNADEDKESNCTDQDEDIDERDPFSNF